MSHFVLLLLVMSPKICYATTGLGGLVLFHYIFYAGIGIALFIFFIFNHSIQRKWKVSIISVAVILILFNTPNLINLYEVVPVDNHPLRDVHKIYATYSDHIIELESGFYYQHYLNPELNIGDTFDLRENNGHYFVLRKALNYAAMPISKQYLFDWPIFKRTYNKFRIFEASGYLTKYENIDKKNSPLLMTNMHACDLTILKMLVTRGLDIEIKTSFGLTMLHKVAYCGSIEHVKYLLDNGADINAQTNDGHTLLDLATRNKNHGYAIIELLLKSGIKPTMTYKEGKTIADRLRAISHERSVKVLQLIKKYKISISQLP